MRALVLRQHGDLDVLRLETDYPTPTAEIGRASCRERVL